MADVANEHVKRYYLKETNELFDREGFKHIQSSHLNFFLFPLLALILIGHRMIYGLKFDNPQRILPKTNFLVNKTLSWILLLEASLMRKFSLPWGVSQMGVYLKK